MTLAIMECLHVGHGEVKLSFTVCRLHLSFVIISQYHAMRLIIATHTKTSRMLLSALVSRCRQSKFVLL